MYKCFYTFTSGRTETCEQWLLLGSRAKNWEAGGHGRRDFSPYILCAFAVLNHVNEFPTFFFFFWLIAIINLFKKREAEEKSS